MSGLDAGMYGSARRQARYSPTPYRAPARPGRSRRAGSGMYQRAVAAELRMLIGYEVVVACDGHDALELLRAGLRPRVIVLDLAMPRINGWAFLERPRGPERSSVPLVVTSGDVGTRRPEGADLCLERPLDPSELRSAVARLDAAAPDLVPNG